jgi:hypothetical protein
VLNNHCWIPDCDKRPGPTSQRSESDGYVSVVRSGKF